MEVTFKSGASEATADLIITFTTFTFLAFEFEVF